MSSSTAKNLIPIKKLDRPMISSKSVKKNFKSSNEIEMQPNTNKTNVYFPPINRQNKNTKPTNKLSFKSLYSQSNTKSMTISQKDKDKSYTTEKSSNFITNTDISKKSIKFCSNKSNISIFNDFQGMNFKKVPEINFKSNKSLNHVVNEDSNIKGNQTFQSENDLKEDKSKEMIFPKIDDRKFSIMDIPAYYPTFLSKKKPNKINDRIIKPGSIS